MFISFAFVFVLTAIHRWATSLQATVNEGLRLVQGVNLEPLGKMMIGLLLISVVASLINRQFSRDIGLAASRRIEDLITTTIAIVCGVFGALGSYEFLIGYFCSSCNADPNAGPVLLRVVSVWLQGSFTLLFLALIRHGRILFTRQTDA